MSVSLLGLEGKKALIVGGGRGMGEASALLLAEAGCDVAVLDSVMERAEQVASEVRAIGRAGVPIEADILDEASVKKAVADAEGALGGLDILVTIVGQALFKPLLDVTLEEWDYDQSRNLRYFFVTARAVAQSMIARGVPGSLICIGSVDGAVGSPMHAPYGAAKAGLMHLVKSMATEWGAAWHSRQRRGSRQHHHATIARNGGIAGAYGGERVADRAAGDDAGRGWGCAVSGVGTIGICDGPQPVRGWRVDGGEPFRSASDGDQEEQRIAGHSARKGVIAARHASKASCWGQWPLPGRRTSRTSGRWASRSAGRPDGQLRSP